MPVQWIKTRYPGVRYYQHNTRKVGVKFDQYFVIRYQHEGKRHEEGLGWASEGWSAVKANAELSKLKEAARLGDGPQRLTEKRQLEKERREIEQKQTEAERRASITFKEYFEDTYHPEAKSNKKKGSYEAERYLFDGWIEPTIGALPFDEILPLSIRAIKKRMSDAGRSTATIKYAYAVISQVWNHARSDGLVNRDCPIKDKTAKLEKINNRRMRFLTHEEADKLLADLQVASSKLHDMAVLSLHCGLRAGEIFNLTWDCVDFKQGTLLLKDTKAKNSRYAYMTNAVKEMLKGRKKKGSFVFMTGPDEPVEKTKRKWKAGKAPTPKKITSVSNAFDVVVKRLGFNKDVDDRRDRVVFHSLRHTFASWHVMNGTDLYVVKELMGHSTIKMTERYAHLQEGSLRQSVKLFEQSLQVHEVVTPEGTGTN